MAPAPAQLSLFSETPLEAPIVYVDEPFEAVGRDTQTRRTGNRHGHLWCHMWSEDVEALHAMARKIGMKRAWFQDKPGFPHYDLVPPRRAAAVRLGAKEVSLVDYLRQRRKTAIRREGG